VCATKGRKDSPAQPKEVKVVMNLSSKAFLRLVIAASLVVGLLVPAYCLSADATKSGPVKAAPGSSSWILYSLEFRRPCGPPVMPSFLGEKILSAFLKEGIQISLGGPPSLMSRENLKYSLVATQGATDLRTGRIYAEVGPGSELSFKNTEGKAVVLQIDVNEVCWDVDRSATLAMAKESKADRVLLARFQVEDLTSDANVQEKLGKQKSFRVDLDLVAMNVSNGRVVGAFSEERRQMDISREGAVSKAAKYLAGKAASYFKQVGERKAR